MKTKALNIALGALLAVSSITPATALPGLGGQPDLQSPSLVQQVQLVCNTSRCIDPRTGAFT